MFLCFLLFTPLTVVPSDSTAARAVASTASFMNYSRVHTSCCRPTDNPADAASPMLSLRPISVVVAGGWVGFGEEATWEREEAPRGNPGI